MNPQIPIDGPVFDALRGVLTAARHYRGDSFPAAVALHTRDLSRGELIELVALLGAMSYLTAPGTG